MKSYDLEERTKLFSKSIRKFFKNQDLRFYTKDDVVQLIRSSASIGANYIEANESLSKKDFNYRIKICQKEAKETHYWLDILSDSYDNLDELIKEILELRKIFGAIYSRTE